MSWLRGNGKVRKDQTDHYGRVKGDGGAKVSDFQDSGSILVEQDATTKKIFFELDDSILDDSASVKVNRNTSTGKISFKSIAKNINASTDYDLKFVRCTQAEYNALTTKDADTLYIIVG